MTEARPPHANLPEPTPKEYGLEAMSPEQRAFYESHQTLRVPPATPEVGFEPFGDAEHTIGRTERIRQSATRMVGRIASRLAPKGKSMANSEIQEIAPPRLAQKAAGDSLPELPASWLVPGTHVPSERVAPQPTMHEKESDKAYTFGRHMVEVSTQSPEESVFTFVPVPSFTAQIAEASHRTTLLRTVRSEVDGNLGVSKIGLETVTEGDAILELDAFLQHAAHKISDEYDPLTGQPAMMKPDQVAHFRENLAFIGRPELQEAVEGIAAYWKQSLLADPDQQILLVSPNKLQEKPVRKSSEYIGDHILKEFTRITQDDSPHIRGRVRRFEEVLPRIRSHFNEHTKIVIPEDWIASGTTIKNNVSTIQRLIAKTGEQVNQSQIETNLIVARADQVSNGITVKGKTPLRTIAYYESPPATIYGGPLPTGFHSTEDYGFSEVLQKMGSAMARKTKHNTTMPALANVRPEYYVPGQA